MSSHKLKLFATLVAVIVIATLAFFLGTRYDPAHTISDHDLTYMQRSWDEVSPSGKRELCADRSLGLSGFFSVFSIRGVPPESILQFWDDTCL